MNWTTPERGTWVAHFNALGESHLDGGKALLPLDADQLIADAEQANGLNDFGDDWFREPLGVLVRSLNEEAQLNTLGRLVARPEILRTLQYRLLLEHEISAHPEIIETPVAPVHVVTGLGRSGTSILHELLTLDPDNRVPIQREMMYPVPAPEKAMFDDNERIARGDLEICYM